MSSRITLRVYIVLICVFFKQVNASVCEQQQIQLHVLGSGGPELDDGRASSSYLVLQGGQARYLLDTGSGASLRFGESQAEFEHLDAIFLSHLHTDHSADLPAFVKGAFFTRRSRDLRVFGPGGNERVPATSEFIQRLFSESGAFSYLSDYLVKGEEAFLVSGIDAPLSKAREQRYQLTENALAFSLATHHGPIPAVAWKLDFSGCKIVYAGDMNNKHKRLAGFAKDADLLIVHNAIPEFAGSIAKNLHITPSQIAQIAKESKVKHLLISHFMNRTQFRQQQLLKTLKASYKGKITVAEDLMILSL